MRNRDTQMSSFGKWYDEQKSNQGNGTSSFDLGGMLGGGGGGGDSSNSRSSEDEAGGMTLPLFNNGSVPADFGWGNFKSSLEAQMPQQIMGMNYQQRFRMFCALLCLSGLFFALGFAVGIPMITVRPQKFALCFTFGSLTFMGSFAILRGPHAHLSGMLAADRLPFTTVYLASMLATLYFTFSVRGASGYVTVMISSGLQLLALLWYLITFLPGGSQGMKVLTQAIGALLRPLILGCTKCWGKILSRVIGVN